MPGYLLGTEHSPAALAGRSEESLKLLVFFLRSGDMITIKGIPPEDKYDMQTISDEYMRQMPPTAREYCAVILKATAKRREPG